VGQALSIDCKNCYINSQLCLSRFTLNKKIFFYCAKCGPLCSSFSFSFENKEIIDFKFNLLVENMRYTIYSSSKFSNCLVYLSVDREPLIELDKFFILNLSSNIENQMIKIVEKAINLKNFR